MADTEDSFQELSKEYIDIEELIKSKQAELSELCDKRDKIRLKLIGLLNPINDADQVNLFNQPESYLEVPGNEDLYSELDALVYTDASYSEEYDIATYAYLIRMGDGRTSRMSGAAPELVGEKINSTTAEIFAVDQAIKNAIKEYRPVRIFVFTDCQAIINGIRDKEPKGIRWQWFMYRF